MKGTVEIFCGQFPGRWWYSGSHSEICNDEQEKNQERCNSHRPSVADLVDKVVDHYWEDDTTSTGTSGQYTKCSTSFFVKPATDATES